MPTDRDHNRLCGHCFASAAAPENQDEKQPFAPLLPQKAPQTRGIGFNLSLSSLAAFEI